MDVRTWASGPDVINDSETYAKKLSALIRLRTVSFTEYDKVDLTEYRKLPDYFTNHFPLLTAAVEHHSLNEYAHIFHWKGSDPSLRPALLLAHFDVVPADSAEWSVDPFSGLIDRTHVWGRGSLDTKCTMAGILEAAERLLAQGFKPKRSLYFAFGGDEETFGVEGAQKIAAYFESEGIEFEFLIDEGTIIADGMLDDVEAPIALIGTGEKGYADIVLETKGRGGHASMPSKDNPATILAAAVGRLEQKKPKRRLSYSVRHFLRALVPHVSFWKGLVYANLWLFAPVVKKAMSKSGQTRALIQTTEALTMIDAGTSANVLPLHGRCVYNVRILPGETVMGTLERFRRTVNNPAVEVFLLDEREVNDPLPETAIDDGTARKLMKVVRGVAADAVIAPFLSTVTTDSKYYRNCTKRIYRFVPMVLNAEELGLIHGIDERISKENLGRILRFYVDVMITMSE